MRTILAQSCLIELKKEAIKAAHEGNLVSLKVIRERLGAVKSSKDKEDTAELVIIAFQGLETQVEEAQAKEITKIIELKKVA